MTKSFLNIFEERMIRREVPVILPSLEKNFDGKRKVVKLAGFCTDDKRSAKDHVRIAGKQ